MFYKDLNFSSNLFAHRDLEPLASEGHHIHRAVHYGIRRPPRRHCFLAGHNTPGRRLQEHPRHHHTVSHSIHHCPAGTSIFQVTVQHYNFTLND